MRMGDMRVGDLISLTASSAPAPGGGSVSALIAAFSAALLSMVGNLTYGKKKYEKVWPQMQEIISKAQVLSAELLENMEKDTEAFNAVMQAVAMPKETEEQKRQRDQAKERALKKAVEVPLLVAQKASVALLLSETLVQLGNKNAITDALVAGMSARTAALGAILNAKINLASLQDVTYVQKMRTTCDELWRNTLETEKRIIQSAETMV